MAFGSSVLQIEISAIGIRAALLSEDIIQLDIAFEVGVCASGAPP